MLIRAMLLFVLALPVAAASELAIVTHDQVALRSSGKVVAVLWAGETIEVRSEGRDELLVYDYRRERGGHVPLGQVRRLSLSAPDLLSALRSVRDQPGKEALGIGYAAAFIATASAETVNGEAGIEVLDALGTLADRLAQRASATHADLAVDAHLEVASRHGVRFVTYEHAGALHVCYDGAAFRRVLAMKPTPEQRARAAIALTRPECMSEELLRRPTLWTGLVRRW